MTITSTPPIDATDSDSDAPPPPSSPSAWGRLGSFGFRRRWWVLGAWVTILVTVFALVGAIGASSDSSFSIPDSESKSGFDTLDQYFGGAGSGRSGTIIFRADQGVDDPEVVAAMTELFDEVGAIDGVTLITPFSQEGALLGLIATEGPLAGQVAYAQVDLAENLSETQTGEIGAEIAELKPTDIEGLQVEVGGQALGEFEPPESELIGLGFAIVTQPIGEAVAAGIVGIRRVGEAAVGVEGIDNAVLRQRLQERLL